MILSWARSEATPLATFSLATLNYNKKMFLVPRQTAKTMMKSNSLQTKIKEPNAYSKKRSQKKSHSL